MIKYSDQDQFYVWGSNYIGELGLGNSFEKKVTIPQLNSFLTNKKVIISTYQIENTGMFSQTINFLQNDEKDIFNFKAKIWDIFINWWWK